MGASDWTFRVTIRARTEADGEDNDFQVAEL